MSTLRFSSALLLLSTLWLPNAAHAVDPDTCIALAETQAKGWLEQELPKEEIDRRYQVAIATCLDDKGDPGVACIVGSANFSQGRFASLFLSEKLNAAEYIALSRSHGRKVRAALKDPIWTKACLDGDEDEDLIPDRLDRCPRTPDLTVTDSVGCPTRDPLPEAPDGRAVRNILDHTGFIFGHNCEKAPRPTVPEPIKLGYNNVDRSDLALAVERVSNQPPGCEIFFEVQIRMIDPVNPNVAPIDYAFMVFADNENTDPNNTARHVFRISGNDTGQRLGMYDDWRYYNKAVWRVRAMNGSGLTSAWSMPRQQVGPSFNEP